MTKLFFSYSHKDEELRDALEVHLAMLKREGLIEALHDRRIVAGEPLDDAIDAYLEEADVILCLLSPDFIASDYCYSREMRRALERHAAGEAVVIPVVLRHCDWDHTPLGGLRGTPRDNKPVKAWPDIDEALHNIATDVRQAVKKRGTTKPYQKADPIKEFAEPAAEVRPRPRSANLHLPRSLTDKDRDDFVERAFEFLAEFFANSVDELGRRNPQLSGKFTRIDAHRFTAALYRDGKKISGITVYIGASWGRARGISYLNNDSGDTNSSNGSFSMPDQGVDLRFAAPHSFGGQSDLFDQEQMAEAVWASFMDRLQR